MNGNDLGLTATVRSSHLGQKGLNRLQTPAESSCCARSAQFFQNIVKNFFQHIVKKTMESNVKKRARRRLRTHISATA
jgi:hypothetical protein